jgi:hypothetical protein
MNSPAKRCSKCQQIVALERFSYDRTHADGHASMCKICKSAWLKQRYTKDREKILARARVGYKRDPTKYVEKQKEYRAKNLEHYEKNRAQWRAVNKDRIREYTKKNRALHRDKYNARRRASTLKEYGLTPTLWQQMYDSQRGLCACCGMKKSLHVDHDHVTGLVRSLLCCNCNFAAGHVKDDPLRADKLATYLRKHTRRES